MFLRLWRNKLCPCGTLIAWVVGIPWPKTGATHCYVLCFGRGFIADLLYGWNLKVLYPFYTLFAQYYDRIVSLLCYNWSNSEIDHLNILYLYFIYCTRSHMYIGLTNWHIYKYLHSLIYWQKLWIRTCIIRDKQ